MQAKQAGTKIPTKQNLKELEMRLTIRLGAMMVIANGVVVALIKL